MKEKENVKYRINKYNGHSLKKNYYWMRNGKFWNFDRTSNALLLLLELDFFLSHFFWIGILWIIGSIDRSISRPISMATKEMADKPMPAVANRVSWIHYFAVVVVTLWFKIAHHLLSSTSCSLASFCC